MKKKIVLYVVVVLWCLVSCTDKRAEKTLIIENNILQQLESYHEYDSNKSIMDLYANMERLLISNKILESKTKESYTETLLSSLSRNMRIDTAFVKDNWLLFWNCTRPSSLGQFYISFQDNCSESDKLLPNKAFVIMNQVFSYGYNMYFFEHYFELLSEEDFSKEIYRYYILSIIAYQYQDHYYQQKGHTPLD